MFLYVYYANLDVYSISLYKNSTYSL